MSIARFMDYIDTVHYKLYYAIIRYNITHIVIKDFEQLMMNYQVRWLLA